MPRAPKTEAPAPVAKRVPARRKPTATATPPAKVAAAVAPVLETTSSTAPKASPTAKSPAPKAKAAPRAKKAVASAPRIFQIYFEPWQRDLLDPAFEPFDNGKVASEWLEVDVFQRIAASKVASGAPLWGALSWRFAEKSGMTGDELIAAIAAAPGKDVYFCNPHPQNEALYHNMWQQGETAHPRFLAVARAVIEAAGLPANATDVLAPSEHFSAANYFVGTPAFWDRYLSFVRSVMARADQALPADMAKLLHSTGADNRGLHGGSTYQPFIVERLFPLFLATEGAGLAAHKIALPKREAELNVHLKLLREMKDVGWKTRSPWLAACWVNYRNLYLLQLHGQDWCRQYLRSVTPAELAFA